MLSHFCPTPRLNSTEPVSLASSSEEPIVHDSAPRPCRGACQQRRMRLLRHGCAYDRDRDRAPHSSHTHMKKVIVLLLTAVACSPAHNGRLHTVQVTLEVTRSRVRAFWQQSNRSGQSDTRPSLARTTLACSCFPRDAHSPRSRPPPRTRRYPSGSGLSRCSTPFYDFT